MKGIIDDRLKNHRTMVVDDRVDDRWMEERSEAIRSGKFRTATIPMVAPGTKLEVRSTIGKTGGSKTVIRYRTASASVQVNMRGKPKNLDKQVGEISEEMRKELRKWAMKKKYRSGMLDR